MEYPKDFPSNAVKTFLNAVIHPDQASLTNLCKDGWEMLGYLLNISVGEPTETFIIDQKNISNETIELFKKLQEHPNFVGMNADWKLVIQAIISLAITLLNRSK